jgi:hypothetical protein
MKKVLLFIICIVFYIAAEEAEKTETADDTASNYKLIGHASYQGGQVLSGSYRYPNDIGHYWFQRVFGNIGFIKNVNDWLSVQVGFEIGMFPSFVQGSTFPETQRASPQPYIDQARGDLKLFNSDETNLSLTVGYFYFRYNKEVRNLGNNLFKSYCYPTVIVQPEFDFPFTRVCGLDFHASLFNGKFDNDFLFTTELQLYPAGDFSITDVIGYKPISCLNIGAGIQLNRLLTVNEKLTTPSAVSRQVDPANPLDTIFYTFAGTKLMALLNFDPKKLIFSDNDQTPFGEEDLKIYGEINILGLKNYYLYYDTLSQRIPISMGFNIPTFKFLDVLAVEAEYFGTRFPNSIEKPVNSNVPEPDKRMEFRSGDPWTWSLYAKKSISSFDIIAQAARDHLQLFSVREQDRQFHDNLINVRDWYYQIKFQFNF